MIFIPITGDHALPLNVTTALPMDRPLPDDSSLHVIGPYQFPTVYRSQLTSVGLMNTKLVGRCDGNDLPISCLRCPGFGNFVSA